MLNGAYHIVVIAVAVWGLLGGYRKGIFRLAGSVLAVAFGVVASRIASPYCEQYVSQWLPGFIDGFQRPFVISTLTAGGIFIAVMVVVELLTFPLGTILRVLGKGIIGSVGGALFRMFQYLMVLSVAYNLNVDLEPAGDLAKFSRIHDGNVIESVMVIAPAVLDFPGGEEVGHRQQLEDAKKIS